jgi:hypothetical protein
VRQFLERKQNRGRVLGFWYGRDLQKPEIFLGGFGACEEEQRGLGRVVKRTRLIVEHGMVVRSNQGGDTKQGVREWGVREEVNRDRQELMREGELSCDVIRAANLQTVAIWQREWDLGQELSDEKRRKCGKIS